MDSTAEILKLSGQLANAAKLVTTANVINLSSRIQDLESVLNEYNNKIIEHAKKQINENNPILK